MSDYSPLCERCLKRMVDCDRFYREQVEQCADFTENETDFDDPTAATETITAIGGLLGTQATVQPTVQSEEQDIDVVEEQEQNISIDEPPYIDQPINTNDSKLAYILIAFGLFASIPGTLMAKYMGFGLITALWVAGLISLYRGISLLKSSRRVWITIIVIAILFASYLIGALCFPGI